YRHHRAVRHRQLAADDRPHALLARRPEEPRRAVDSAAIANRHRRHPARRRRLRQLRRLRRPPQKAERRARVAPDVLGFSNHNHPPNLPLSPSDYDQDYEDDYDVQSYSPSKTHLPSSLTSRYSPPLFSSTSHSTRLHWPDSSHQCPECSHGPRQDFTKPDA